MKETDMIMVDIREARKQFTSLLDRVSKGERFIITRHGVSVAELVPVQRPASSDINETISGLRSFGHRRSLGGSSTRELIDDGRRY